MTPQARFFFELTTISEQMSKLRDEARKRFEAQMDNLAMAERQLWQDAFNRVLEKDDG